MLAVRCVCARSIWLSLFKAGINMCLEWVQELSDRLVHIIPRDDYMWYHRDLATAYVRVKVADRYIRSQGVELLTTLVTSPTPTYSVLFDHHFEIYCLAKLAEGGSFPMRSLDEPGKH